MIRASILVVYVFVVVSWSKEVRTIVHGEKLYNLVLVQHAWRYHEVRVQFLQLVVVCPLSCPLFLDRGTRVREPQDWRTVDTTTSRSPSMW